MNPISLRWITHRLSWDHLQEPQRTLLETGRGALVPLLFGPGGPPLLALRPERRGHFWVTSQRSRCHTRESRL